MQLSQNTLNVLKNFASINGNLVVNEGNVIRTMSVSKSVYAVATLEESFPSSFGIYDLNEFLSVMSLVDEPSLEISDKSVRISGNTRSEGVTYFFADSSILSAPTKDVKMPEVDVKININTNDLSKLIKAASVLGHTELCFKGENGRVIATISDTKNSTANTYSFTLLEDSSLLNEFSFNINISNLKLIQGEYKVSFSKLGISNWKSDKIEYFIALEKSSSFK